MTSHLAPPHLGQERAYRGADVVEKLQKLHVVVCGAGALGGNLAEHLARMGVARLRVIDKDRIEERNLANQPWTRADVGQQKATLLAKQLYRAVGADVEARALTLDAGNVSELLKSADVVVDCFDNSASRAIVKAACASTPCLHVGLAKGYAEVIWEPRYAVPDDGGEDVCDVGLARSLVTMAVAVAAEAIVTFAATSATPSFTITLADLKVSALP